MSQSISTNDDLIQNIKQWVKINETLKEKEEPLKELKKMKIKYHKILLEYIKNRKLNEVNWKYGSSKINYKKTLVKQSIDKNYLLTSLNIYFKDEKKAEDCTQFILDNRNNMERYTLEIKKINK